MGLLDLFKRKSKTGLDAGVDAEVTNGLSIGILFEDNEKLLKWGIPISDLAKQVEVA